MTESKAPVEVRVIDFITSIITDWPQFDTDESVNGGDAVEYLEGLRADARGLLKAMGKDIPKKREPLAFAHFQVRACIEFDGEVQSFLDEDVRDEAAAQAERNGKTVEKIWTLFGCCADGTSMAIGDFTFKADALEVQNAILAPMAEARNELQSAIESRLHPEDGKQARQMYCDFMGKIADFLDDVIGQSSNGERL